MRSPSHRDRDRGAFLSHLKGRGLLSAASSACNQSIRRAPGSPRLLPRGDFAFQLDDLSAQPIDLRLCGQRARLQHLLPCRNSSRDTFRSRGIGFVPIPVGLLRIGATFWERMDQPGIDRREHWTVEHRVGACRL